MIRSVQIDASDPAVAEALADCQVGDLKTITFEITSKTGSTISGTATEVAYADEQEDGSEEEYAEQEVEEAPAAPEPKSSKKGGKKVPKAVVLIGMGK